MPKISQLPAAFTLVGNEEVPLVQSGVTVQTGATQIANTLSAINGTITGTYTLAGAPSITAPTISSPTVTGTETNPDGSVWTTAGLSSATLNAPTISSASITGPIIVNPTILAPVLSGTATGTYAWGGTPSLAANLTATGYTVTAGTFINTTLGGTTNLADGGSATATGISLGAATNGVQGSGSLNAQALYVNGVAVSAGGTVNAGASGAVAYYSAASATVSGATLTALLDSNFGSTEGDILYRGASAWLALAPGTSGNFLQTLGNTAAPQWVAAGGVTICAIQAFASSGTYTPTAGMKFCIVYGYGAGGGGANSGGGNGGTGGTTSLGSLLTAAGGTGGQAGGTAGTGGTGGTLGKINGSAGGAGNVGLGNAAGVSFGGSAPMMIAPSDAGIAGTLPGQGGGGLGGTPAVNPSGGGGGGGELSFGVFSAATIGASQTVTIGAAGAAGSGGGVVGFKGYLYIVEYI